MDMQWLQTFVTAAREGNFHRTAEKLHLAQPTVSLHVQKLEHALGSLLFDRIGKTIQLNAAGYRFLPHAEELLQKYTVGVEDIARLVQGYQETLSVAASPLVATTLLPRWIQGFQKLHPNVDYSIQVVESEPVIQRVLSRQADLGLGRIPFQHPQFVCDRLYDDPIVMVAPAQGSDHDAPLQSGHDWLSRSTLFTNNHPGYWEDLLPALRRLCPGLRSMRVSLVHVSLHWIQEGMGVSFLPLSTVRREFLRGRMEEVPFPYLPLPVAATYLIRHRASLTPIAAEFALFISTYMAERPL
jgi:LysR family transcriptional regulator, repressor for citA